VRVLKNPVAQFLAAGIVIVTAVALVSDVLSHRAAEREAIEDARAMTDALAAAAETNIPMGMGLGSVASAGIFDRQVGRRLLLDNVEQIKIWDANGLIVYSDDASLIGKSFTLSDNAERVLRTGRSSGDLTDGSRSSSHYEVEESGLLEVYTRIQSFEDDPLLFEVYYSEEDLEQTTAVVLDAFRPITVGGALAIGLLTIPLLIGLNRRLGRASAARERLLRAAVDASEEERRRIARDLHDGVGHRIRAAADALAAEAVDLTTPPSTARRLREVDDQLRTTAESLRSLVLDIYPPELDAARLEDALGDLVAPAADAGLLVKVEVDDLGQASDDAVALVWRVAREGVRNAVRHARSTSLAVSVHRSRSALELRVADDGVGFVPGAFRQADRFGLRGLEDLAVEAGGSLSVSSGPGRGTVLTLQVPTA
jgi:two-component system, NarL family, sensor kinase